MSIHDIIHTDSSAVTAWLSKRARILFYGTVALIVLVVVTRVLHENAEREAANDVSVFMHSLKK